MAELISCFVVLILLMFLHLELETSESVYLGTMVEREIAVSRAFGLCYKELRREDSAVAEAESSDVVLRV
jgi:hypothetical protein